MKIIITCPCGKDIKVSKALSKRKKYCSKKCFYEYRKPRPSGLKYEIKKENSAWFKKGHKPWHTGRQTPYFDKSTGYWKICIDGKEKKYHRHLMEKKLRRALNDEEVVHHIDNDVNNNNIENLWLFQNKSEHLRHHWATTRRKSSVLGHAAS